MLVGLIEGKLDQVSDMICLRGGPKQVESTERTVIEHSTFIHSMLRKRERGGFTEEGNPGDEQDGDKDDEYFE
jgi:hypothetical protein